jgi:hypothetical protein
MRWAWSRTIGDGTGIGVAISYADPAALHTIKVRDSARCVTAWRTVGTQVGPGTFIIPVEDTGGDGLLAVTFSRTWWIHVTTEPSFGGFVESLDYLVTPTQGYPSAAFAMLLAIKHKIIRAIWLGWAAGCITVPTRGRRLRR